MKYKGRTSGLTVELGADNFFRKGGEGSTFVIGDTVYKICEPGKMIPEAKILELAALTHPKIITPQDVLLDGKTPVGYTMNLVPNKAIPLARILSKAYREREGVTHEIMSKLVLQIYDGIKNGIHKFPGYLQVDGNTFNYMVTSDYQDVYFIDVNSFQTPNFPASAIMPSIRYWKCGTDFTQLTDWFSFAVVSWHMFTAIGPYQHMHPRFPNQKVAMIEMMKAGISILDKDSEFPADAIYHPFETVIPGGANGAYMQWYKSILVDNKLSVPPDGYQAVLKFVAKINQIIGSNKFDMKPIHKYASKLINFYCNSGREVAITSSEIYVDNQPKAKLGGKVKIGFSKNNVPHALVLDDDTARIYNLETATWTSFEVKADDIMSCEGRLYIKYLKNMYEINFPPNAALTPTQSMVAQVMSKATQLFDGVAFQDIYGVCFASIFPKSGSHQQIKLIEIDKHTKIVDAKYEGNVLMIVVLDAERGQHDRLIFRFDTKNKDWSKYDVRKIENIIPTGINFTVLNKGICACITEDQKVEIFQNAYGTPSITVVEDPAVNSGMHLCHIADQVCFAHNSELYSLSMKP